MGEIVVVRPGDERKTIYGAGDEYSFLAAGEATDGRYTFVEALIPPGGGPPPHIHTREEEVFYILEGELAFSAGGRRVIATPHTFLHIPRGVPHGFRNELDVPARMVFFFVPGGIEAMFEKMGADPLNYIAIGKEFGVEFVDSV